MAATLSLISISRSTYFMQRNTDQTLMNTSEMIYLSVRSIVRYNLDTILCYQTMKININEILIKTIKTPTALDGLWRRIHIILSTIY